MGVEVYTYQNRKEINEVYLHDSLFYDVIINIEKKTIEMNLNRWEPDEYEYDKYNKCKVTFENVLHFEFDRLDFWGDGGERINTIFLGDDNLPHNYIKGKLEKATEEYRAKNCSDPQDFFSKDKEKFINIGLEIMSGDIISIICEKMIIGDCV